MARFVLFFAIVVLALQNIVAQPVTYPKLNMVRFFIPGTPIPPGILDIRFDLELTGAAKKNYDEMIKGVREFIESFEKEKEQREKEYLGSSGETRIQKARALLDFVVRSEEEWQKFTIGIGTEWTGPYTSKFNMYGLAEGEGKADAQIQLTGAGLDSKSINPKKLTGTLNGKLDATVGMNLIPITKGDQIKGSGSFEIKDELSGTSENGRIWLTRHKPNIGDGSMSLFGPGLYSHVVAKNGIITGSANVGNLAYAYQKSDGTHTSGYVLAYDFLTGMYVRKDYSETRPPFPGYYYLFEYVDSLKEKINFQELKDKYFRFYITDINRLRLQQYNSGDLEEKARLGEATLRELSSAHSYGQVIGVSGFVFQELMLIYQTTGSLYDDWFRLWFKPSDEIWQKRIQGSGNENAYKDLEGRVKNAIGAIGKGQMIASDELMQELQLVPKSDFMTGIIRDYFVKGNEIHCASRLENKITDEEFRQWKLQVYRAAVVYASDEVASMIANSNCPSQ